MRSRLATVLAAGVTDFNATLDAKILGIALRLDPANRAARDAADRRKRGELPDAKPATPGYSTATVVSYLTGQCAGLRAKGGADNLALAGYLGAIALEIAPEDPVAKYEKTAYSKNNPAPAWTFLKGKPEAKAETLPLLKKQGKIKGLTMSELPGGERTGAVLEVLVTAEEARTRQEVGVTVSQPVGNSMRISIQEAARAVRLRHPSFGAGERLVVSFGDNYTSKDGPSACTAFTLLLYSLYDPVKIATDCAVTGDMTVDGRVRAVGGVPSKLHAALIDGCHIVAIPKENVKLVADLTLLYPANTLWKLQIFTVDTLDEALAVMREDRAPDLQKAIDLFAAVQQKVGMETPRLGSANLGLAPQLKEILRLAPGHASAAAMLKMLEGKMPATLSLYSSLDEVERITHATMKEAAPTRGQYGLDPQALGAGIERLEAMRGRLDFRVTELWAADLAGLRALQALVAGARTPEGFAEYRQRLAALNEVERRMSSDPALVEGLRRETTGE